MGSRNTISEGSQSFLKIVVQDVDMEKSEGDGQMHLSTYAIPSALKIDISESGPN